MKNRAVLALLIAACIFSSGLMGFFIGRNTAGAVVEVSTLNNTQTQTVPPTTQVETTAPPTTQPASSDFPVETAPLDTTQPIPTQTQPANVEKININTATLEQLDTLPGIGPVLAQRIIDYREENGPFSTVSELSMVSGIGLAKLEKLLDYVTVGGEE